MLDIFFSCQKYGQALAEKPLSVLWSVFFRKGKYFAKCFAELFLFVLYVKVKKI